MYTIRLDTRLLKTPQRNCLCVPSLPLAYALAGEWDRQEEAGIRSETMPLTSLAFTAIDQITMERDIVIEECMKVGGRFGKA